MFVYRYVFFNNALKSSTLMTNYTSLNLLTIKYIDYMFIKGRKCTHQNAWYSRSHMAQLLISSLPLRIARPSQAVHFPGKKHVKWDKKLVMSTLNTLFPKKKTILL